MSRGKGTTDRPAKRPYRSWEERRAQIVEATLTILAEDGLHALTTSTLAARVGVSEATLFKHFESKDAILAEALRRQAAELRERIEAYRSEGAPWERATGLVRHVLDYLEERDGGPLVILLGHASRIRPEMEAEMKRTLGRFRERIATFLGDEIGPGRPREGSPALERHPSISAAMAREGGARAELDAAGAGLEGARQRLLAVSVERFRRQTRGA